MAQVIVRNIDDEVVKRLKARATRHGHSLEQELRDVLTIAAKPDREALLALADKVRAMTPSENVGKFDSTKLIREDRDSR